MERQHQRDGLLQWYDSHIYTVRQPVPFHHLYGNDYYKGKGFSRQCTGISYTWSFTTTGDADPPTVSSTNPANGGAGAAINRIITAAFSEAMQSSTINTNTFTVSDGIGKINGTVSYSGTTAAFTPSRNLSASTTYTARITTGGEGI